MKFITSLPIVILFTLFSCTKPADTNDSEVPEEIKPEWRIKRVLTEASNLKILTLWRDTMRFEYDTLGRFSKISYRLFGLADHPAPIQDYTTYVGDDLIYEYHGNEEKLHKYYQKRHDGKLQRTATFSYDNSGKNPLQLLYTDNLGAKHSQYDFKYGNGNQLTGYSYLIFQPFSTDSQHTTLTYSGNNLIKKVNSRVGGANVNTFIFDYNAAGNSISSLVLGQYPPMRPDTMRKIFLTWKPSITPNINKVKRPPYAMDELLHEWPNFFFASRNQLLEFDFFNLASRGELLDSYYFTLNIYTLMESKLQLTYFLDNNQNINKITGSVPGGIGTFEMNIEYEKIE